MRDGLPPNYGLRRVGRSQEPPDHTEEVVREARTGSPFRHLLYRGEGLPEREKARSRTPAQFAVGEHWTPDPEVALTYGPNVREEEVSLANPYVFSLSGKGFYFEDMRAEFGTADPMKVTAFLKGKGHDGLVVHNVDVMRSYSRAGSTEVIKFDGAERGDPMNFKLKGRVSRSDARTVQQALDQLAAKGSVKEAAEAFMVEAEMEGAGARELK